MNPNHDPMLDYRARIERDNLEAIKRRQQALDDQRSPGNSPEMRVRVWEQLHQLRLPKNPAHAILQVIVRQTGLDLADVREVQRMRAMTMRPA